MSVKSLLELLILCFHSKRLDCRAAWTHPNFLSTLCSWMEVPIKCGEGEQKFLMDSVRECVVLLLSCCEEAHRREKTKASNLPYDYDAVLDKMLEVGGRGGSLLMSCEFFLLGYRYLWVHYESTHGFIDSISRFLITTEADRVLDDPGVTVTLWNQLIDVLQKVLRGDYSLPDDEPLGLLVGGSVCSALISLVWSMGSRTRELLNIT